MPQQSSHEEIAALERLLEEKRQALAAEGKTQPERESFREAFRERYGEALAPKTSIQPSPPPSALPLDELTRHAEEIKTKAREDQIAALIELALTKGVNAAADVARKATPWLMDELHDRLVDHYYEKLVALKKVKAL